MNAMTDGQAWCAVVRPVSDALAACELSFVERSPIDIERARRQHDDYCDALVALGCRLLHADALPADADAVFVEDTAVVVDEVAVITRPGAESRRGETASIAAILSRHRQVVELQAPATLDGGDVLRIGRDVYVGQGARSNVAGFAQLQAALVPHGYRVHAVRTRDCLHLKSAVTALDDDTVLVQPAWLESTDAFSRHRIIEVAEGEEHAANVLRIGERLLMPARFPATHAKLREAGFDAMQVDLSELQKAEGATTCCSIVFRA